MSFEDDGEEEEDIAKAMERARESAIDCASDRSFVLLLVLL